MLGTWSVRIQFKIENDLSGYLAFLTDDPDRINAETYHSLAGSTYDPDRIDAETRQKC